MQRVAPLGARAVALDGGDERADALPMVELSNRSAGEAGDRNGRLVAGHGRVETLQEAKAAGMDAPDGVRVDGDRWLVPVVRGWASRNDDEASAVLVASNRLTEMATWDDAGLAALLEQVN